MDNTYECAIQGLKRAQHMHSLGPEKLAWFHDQCDAYLRKMLGSQSYYTCMIQIFNYCSQINDPHGTQLQQLKITEADRLYMLQTPRNNARSLRDPFGVHVRDFAKELKTLDALQTDADMLHHTEPVELFEKIHAHPQWKTTNTLNFNINNLKLLYEKERLHIKKRTLEELQATHKGRETANIASPVMSGAQYSQVQSLVSTLHTEASAQLHADDEDRDWTVIHDYIVLASQYAAPGERYEGQRRDWHAANFHSGSNVHIHIDTTTVELRIRKMLKTKQPLTINLTEMAPSFARFLIAYKQLIVQSDDIGGRLLFYHKAGCVKDFTPNTYGMRLKRLLEKHDLGDLPQKGCNLARHSSKHHKRGPALTSEQREDLAQQGHSATTDATVYG